MRKVLFLLISSIIYLCGGSPIISSSDQLSSFTIEKTWEGNPVGENEKIKFTLQGVPNSRDILWSIDAPFYDDPPPAGEPGQPFLGLWDYEVVEVFFLNDKDQYLEVEISPLGQHIVLLLNGERNTIRHSLPLDVQTKIEGQKWRANVTIPGHYFPPQVTKLNAYAIHGVGEERKYLSLYPTDGSTSAPDFHNLHFFQPFDIVKINPLHKDYTKLSELWEDSIEGIFKYKISRQWNNFRSKIPPTLSTLQGFEGGIEINFTMPVNDQSYPAESFVVIFENVEKEAVKFQFFVDGNYFVEFFKNRKNKLDQIEEFTLDYRVNDRHSRFVKGSALVPPSLFPPKVTLMNMYSLFGVETMLAMTLRAIEIKSGVDFRPNLSNIEHFTPIDFDLLVASNDEYSPFWRTMLNLPPVKKNDEITTISADEKTEPEGTSPPEDHLTIIKEDTVTPALDEVTEEGESLETTVNPALLVFEREFGTKYDNSKDRDVNEKERTILFNRPLRFLLKNSRTSESDPKKETFSTKEEEDKNSDKISSKNEEKTEENNAEEPKDEPLVSTVGDEDSLIYSNTEDPFVMAEQLETEVATEDNQIKEDTTETPSVVEEDELVTRSVEGISQDNENTEGSETDLVTLVPSVTESMPEVYEADSSANVETDEKNTSGNVEVDEMNSTLNVDSATATPTEDIPADTTLPDVYTSLFEEKESTLNVPEEEGLKKARDEKDKAIGIREEHPRRYEEASDKNENEIPITFKITFDSPEMTKDESDRIRPPEFTPEDSLADDYSLLEEIPDDLLGVDDILPPPHPICFTEGLVPDIYRCQIFYECVLENGRWEVYNWRCKRGSYYDPVKIACIKGYC